MKEINGAWYSRKTGLGTHGKNGMYIPIELRLDLP
jgi:hypothetical protein